MSGLAKRAAQAWGFTAILLLPNYIDLTSGAGDAQMRSPVPLTRIALAQLTDMSIVALLFAAVIWLLRLLPIWRAVRLALLILLPPLLLARNLYVIPFEVHAALVLWLGVLWAGLLLFLLLKLPRAASKIGNAGSVILAGFAIFGVVMSVQLCRAMLWKPGPQSFTSVIPPVDPQRPRLVWIIFDELAYQPVFEARDPSLKLPNFDRLRTGSTLYTDVQPVAYRTRVVIPSLQLGRPVAEVEYTLANRYMLRYEDRSDWEVFDARSSIFATASQLGLTTSIVGWYVPYCPVFAAIATDCYWDNSDAQDRGPTLNSASFWENVWFPLRVLAERALSRGRAWADEAAWNEQGHEASVRNISLHALQTVTTSQADLLYLHLPVPHPLAVWDRRKADFAPGGSYLDSLDYTDRLLGKILDVLEAQPRWASTTLIVQGDHSWRTQMWRPLPGWTAEDERISHGGVFDPRPVLMIHDRGQHSGDTVAAPTSVMYAHRAVEATFTRCQGRGNIAHGLVERIGLFSRGDDGMGAVSRLIRSNTSLTILCVRQRSEIDRWAILCRRFQQRLIPGNQEPHILRDRRGSL